MEVFNNPPRNTWPDLLRRPLFAVHELDAQVQTILNDIKTSGVHALRKYTEKFDGAFIRNFAVQQHEINDAISALDPELMLAIQTAASNIMKFHEVQMPSVKKVETMNGVVCWQKSVPIDKVGLYIPGGSAPLFSTVLMLGIPAKIARCNEVVLCTPPDKDGKINPAILFTAQLIGITQIFKIGGVQAIGAMAYGIDCIPKVDKIFGPGNQYVMAAKQLISLSDVAIDMPAGPSEVAIMADRNANPAFVAADLLSQAEHGVDSQVILLTNSDKLVEGVLVEIENQIEDLPRKAIAAKALENSRAIVLSEVDDLIELVNCYAPEHLIIAMDNYTEVAEMIRNAGSVFLGSYSPESAGDYASGTNHTLPTNGWARSFSGVNLDSFMKKITFQEISAEGMKNVGPVIEKMAAAEHLDGHKNAITLRLKTILSEEKE
jgi:histidinol dehydrogenase